MYFFICEKNFLNIFYLFLRLNPEIANKDNTNYMIYIISKYYEYILKRHVYHNTLKTYYSGFFIPNLKT